MATPNPNQPVDFSQADERPTTLKSDQEATQAINPDEQLNSGRGASSADPESVESTNPFDRDDPENLADRQMIDANIHAG